MGQRWFSVSVVGLWLTTMSWLVVTKLAPPLFQGDPPTYRSIYSKQGDSEPVGWDMMLNRQKLGWAVSSHSTDKSGFTTVTSLVHFNDFPVDEFLPVVLKGIWESAVKVDERQFSMDAESIVDIDSSGQLSRLVFVISSPGVPDTIRLEGHKEGDKLVLKVRVGNNPQVFKFDYPNDSVLGNDLTPQVRLPNLYQGQEWTIPVYSPLRAKGGGVAVEMNQAKVEKRETIMIGKEIVPVWLVTIQPDSGSLFGHSRRARSRLWVDMNGDVVKQFSVISQGAGLSFTRTDASRSRELLTMSQTISEKRRKIELANNNMIDDQPVEEIDLRQAQALLQNVLPRNGESPFQLKKMDFSAEAWKERLKGAVKYIPNVQSNASSTSSSDSIWQEMEKEGASKKRRRHHQQ